MLVAGGPYQLGMDTNPATLSHYRTFDDRVHAERPRNLRHRQLSILEAHYRSSRNDPQILNPGKTSDKLLGHSVCKVILGWISRQVLQWQDRDGFDLGLCGAACSAPGYAVCDGPNGEHGSSSKGDPAAEMASSRWFLLCFRFFYWLADSLFLAI